MNEEEKLGLDSFLDTMDNPTPDPIATPEPELILNNSSPSIDSGGMLNNPPPSP